MSHPDDLLLLQYRFDTLEGDEKGRVADHLRTCSDCTIRYANLGKNVEKLSAWNAEAELSEQVVEDALGRVREEMAKDAGAPQPLGPTPSAAAAEEPAGQADAPTDQQFKITPPPAPPRRRRRSEPEFEPEPEQPPFPGILAWLGLTGGLPSSTARFAFTAVMAVAVLGLGGGQLYWTAKEPRLQTIVSGPRSAIAGDRALFNVSVYDQKKQKPVADAQLELVLIDGAKRTVVASAKSDGQGRAALAFEVPESIPATARYAVEARALGETDSLPQPLELKREVKLHLSTDKPLYQPGQTIHARALALRSPNLTPLSGEPLTFEVRDPKGNRLGSHEVKLGRFGVGSFDFELADGIALGTYEVKATSGTDTTALNVEISRYTLPKFGITLTPERDGYVAGETMRVNLMARTFFGKPVAKGKVSALWVKANGQVIARSTALTSPDGDATLEVSLPTSLGAGGEPEAVRLQVEVSDAAGEMESKVLGTMIGRELLTAAVIPAQGKVALGVENDMFVLVTTPDGKPVASEGTVQISGERMDFKTGANGVGSFRFTPKDAVGPNACTVEVQDATGRRARVQQRLEPGIYAAFISLEKALVAPGEALAVQVRSMGLSENIALELRREGRLIAREVLSAPKDGLVSAKLTVPSSVTGALDLQLVSDVSDLALAAGARRDLEERGPSRRRPPQYIGAPRPIAAELAGVFASRRILVADPRGVAVTMHTDQTPYRPGATAKVRFEVKDGAGKPVAAALGVAVVDESLFALTTARPSLARAFFTLGASLQLSKGPIAATDFAAGAWSDADQKAAQLLFASVAPPQRAESHGMESLTSKQAEIREGKRSFESIASPGWLIWIGILGFVLLMAASRYVSPWLGGVGFAVLIILAGLFVGSGGVVFAIGCSAVLAAIILGVQRGSMPWGLVTVPAAVLLLTWFTQARSPDVLAYDREYAPPRSPSLMQKSMKSFGSNNNYGSDSPRPVAEAVAAAAEMAPLKRGAEAFGDDLGGVAAAVRAPKPMAPAPTAGGKAGGAAPADPEPEPEHREVRVRQYFPETLFVHPELVTDEQGIASLELPIADSITNWRVTALASTAGGKLGTLEEPLKVFQDFFVDLDVPVALVAGDTASIPIAVHNYLSEPQTVRLEVKPVEGIEVLGEKTFKLTAPGGGVAGAELKIRVLTAGRHQLKVHGDGTKLSDEIAKELRVFEAGEERSAVVSGTLQPGKATTVAITLPPAAQAGSARLVARFYGSRLQSALGGLEGALQAPHGCFEQTSSTTYPNVLIWKHLLDTGDKANPAIARARQYVSLGYQKLLTFEVPGGGFEWFGRAPANQVLTAYGLLEFKDMAQVFPVDPNVIERTQNFLVARQNGDGSWSPDRSNLADGLYRSNFAATLNITAYIAWSLAESGYRGEALNRAARYLGSNADQTNDPYTLSLIVGTLARVQHGRTLALAQKLESLAQKNGEQAAFNPDGATVYYSRGTGASAEATALAAQALSAARVGNETVRGALTWLAANRDYRGTWHSTQGTVMALRAILMGARKDVDQTVKLSINGGETITTQVTATGSDAASVDLAAKVKPGDNTVTLEGSGEAPFQIVLTWVQPWREPGADEREALSLGVAFGRTKAKVGDIVPVDLKVTYRKPEASGMVVASLGVPAGLQVLAEDLEALKSRGQLARYELGGGTVTLYFDRLATGATTALNVRFKAVSKVTTKGQGSLAYLYYHPEVKAKAPATAMVVD